MIVTIIFIHLGVNLTDKLQKGPQGVVGIDLASFLLGKMCQKFLKLLLFPGNS